MRWVILLSLLLVPAKTAESPAEAPSSYAKRMDKENIEFLRQLSRMVGEKGFRDVEPVPQMFVFLAKRSDGREITLLVNSDTLQAMELKGTSDFLRSATRALPEGVVPQLH
jgi:hypothetical protein